MTATMRKPHKVGPKGQVVIPKELREAAGMFPGTEVDFVIDGTRITITPKRRKIESWRDLGGMFADGPDMAAGLLEDRARERD